MGIVVAVFPWFFMGKLPSDRRPFLLCISLGMIALVAANLLSDVCMRKLGVKRAIRWHLAQVIGVVAAIILFKLMFQH
jgi:hypothetical protein